MAQMRVLLYSAGKNVSAIPTPRLNKLGMRNSVAPAVGE